MQFVQWILKVKSNVDSGQFRPMQSAVVEALNAPPAWYAEMNGQDEARRKENNDVCCAFAGLFLCGRSL